MPLERATRHSHYNLNYHLVFVPKYRRKVLGGKVGERLKELFEQICGERDWIIHGLEILPDHAHIFISAPPKWAPSDIAKILKGASARWLMMEYPHLKKNGHLWTSAYYVGSAGSVSADINVPCETGIGRYIDAQKGKQVA